MTDLAARVRPLFPGLAASDADGRPTVYFDGPAGSQVPRQVAEAVAAYLLHTNANVGGTFPTSVATTAMLAAARQAIADLVGAADPDAVVFGANMTSLTYALSRALARTWRRGDRIAVTRLDHDANVTPWTQAAAASGVEVVHIDIDPADCTLAPDSLAAALAARPRLVAFTAASNLVGTCTPVAEICAAARAAGAVTFVDAVHWAPHRLTDVAAWGCDLLVCSTYKFFGPHVGVLWGRTELLRELPAERLRPVADALPGRWMHGTQNHEGIAGAAAAVDYLTALAGNGGEPRRARLQAAFAAIDAHERDLCRHLLAGLAELPDCRVHGIADPDRCGERTPTVSITHRSRTPRQLAAALLAAGIYTWPGNAYAVPLTTRLGLEPDGVLRIGMLHYNTHAEVERLLEVLAAIRG